MTSTGLTAACDTFYRGHHIVCLDSHQRLQYNFAIIYDGKYSEFRTIYAARKFVRSLTGS